MSAAVKAVDKELAELEASPRKPEEEEYIQGCLAAASEEEKAQLSELDLLTVVRGYATYKPRMEETIKAFKAINDWRNEVDYYHFFDRHLDRDAEFYQLWAEHVYGEDQYGHMMVGMRVGEIDMRKLADFDVDHLLRLQGQKLALYSRYKEKLSARSGVQRYKYSLIIDLKDVTVPRGYSLMKRVFSVGADYFPESIWKIYLVNSPMIFQVIWRAIRGFIHPITLAKVNLLGKQAKAIKQIQADGVPLSALPEYLGGGAKPVSAFSLLQQEIREQQVKNTQPALERAAEAEAAAAAAAPSSTADADVRRSVVVNGSTYKETIQGRYMGYVASV
eukprot:TRINITY_DN9354_c0_g2_i2.p1 TRINITY_DN9354_c0_g2~~TRINITY_DN9354_c0_g2_i2.p1  ORF type:complete len:333 (+),score=110.69 TRINITY_DN9354_c0_g2_i2:251-1249(+)